MNKRFQLFFIGFVGHPYFNEYYNEDSHTNDKILVVYFLFKDFNKMNHFLNFLFKN